jgi:hypothetical protein
MYCVRLALKIVTSFHGFTDQAVGMTASGSVRNAPHRCKTGSAEVRAVDITSMLLSGCLPGFGTNLGAAALALCINGILPRVLLLYHSALAICLEHFLADFGSGECRFCARIRCDKFSLLSKSSASSSKHGNSSHQFLDDHDSLQRLLRQELAVKMKN